MSPDGLAILRHLGAVEAERTARADDPSLQGRVDAVKHYQHSRFAMTYADLLAQPRYARAARFFLDELYGPHDFTQRDAQFARIVPALVKVFPQDIVGTVRSLAELHALSESLDSELARALPDEALQAPQYVRAWRQVGRRSDRGRQIDLMMQIGRALEGYTRKPLLRGALRMFRGPAQAAGLGALQNFLEAGFDTFREMRGAEEFLGTVASRELAIVDALFDSPGVEDASSATTPPALLGQLP